MRKLSRWAKSHPVSARILIIISRCWLFLLAWFLGKQLAIAVMNFSPLWLCLFVFAFLAACMVYPKGTTAANYAKRKRCDLAVAVSGFMMVVCLTVQLQQPTVFYQTVQATVPFADTSFKEPDARQLLLQYKNGEKTSFTRKEKRLIRKEFNHQLIRYGKATITGDKETQQDAGVIILACIAAVGLLMLVASLACSLSCNGSDAAAVAVAVLGTAAIVWGLIAVIKGGKKKPAKTDP